ncbi:MAG: TaqI family restriction endonuclease [Spirochaetes bacterium]|nr:TaqI family restriction endonuclease [Spirochaetota bacterium]
MGLNPDAVPLPISMELYFEEEIISNPDLDIIGIDGIVKFSNMNLGFQIKKVSFRSEVLDRKFTKRQMKKVDVMVEVPYLVVDVNSFKDTGLKDLFSRYFRELKNGFVVFSQDYLYEIRSVIQKITPESKGTRITYDKFIDVINSEDTKTNIVVKE